MTAATASPAGQLRPISATCGAQATASRATSSFPAPAHRAKQYLNLGEAAEHIGVSESTFHRIRGEDWMPKPIALAPKVLRWSVIELDEALLSRAPRALTEDEPEALQSAREARRTGVIVRSGRIVRETSS